MFSSLRPLRPRARTGALTMLAVVGLAVALAPSAAATGSVPSTTTLSASPSSGTVGSSVTFTAKVSAAVVGGLVVTPSGTVTFSYVSGSSSGTLGSAQLASCLLSACTATLSSNALPPGTSTVTGSYGGDSVVAPSSGSTTVTMNAPVVVGNSSTVTCDPGAYCDSGTVTAANGSGTMDVLSTPSSTKQTVSAQLDINKNLHCPQNTDNQTGPLGTFQVSVSDTTKTVTYTGKGGVGRAMLANYNAHPNYAGCFGSPTPFNGYVYGVYGPAILVHENSGDFYEAQLSNCAAHGGALPCFTNKPGANDADSYIVSTELGDPKIIG